jgi:ribose-phosphate pyrophosphokinase
MNPIAFTIHMTPSLAGALYGGGIEAGVIERRQFPDGESYVRLVSPVAGRDVLLLCSLDRPDALFLPLMFAADAAKQQGARRIGLVAPYLAYMRQDTAFRSGEAITSRSFASLLQSSFDWLVTVDPHLHRYRTLNEIYAIETSVVSAAPAIAAWTRERVDQPFFIGPDVESEQWVSEIAKQVGAPYAVFAKQRHGDKDVQISADHIDIGSRTPIIVDDIVSSARTMAKAVQVVRTRAATDPLCVGVHGIFAGDGLETLMRVGPSAIVTSDTVKHSTNGYTVVDVLRASIRAWSSQLR